MKKQLQEYYDQLDQQHRMIREKYRKENPGIQGFTYEKSAWKKQDREKLDNVKQQKLCIKKLLKLIEESENE